MKRRSGYEVVARWLGSERLRIYEVVDTARDIGEAERKLREWRGALAAFEVLCKPAGDSLEWIDVRGQRVRIVPHFGGRFVLRRAP